MLPTNFGNKKCCQNQIRVRYCSHYKKREEGWPLYAALLADVKGSKGYGNKERHALQERIDLTIRYLNDMYRGMLVKEVGFSGGDEIQGLFADPISAYMYYRLLSLTLGVGAFRCGIGVGNWDVKLGNRKESAAQDGEAYHLAREAIGEAARSDYYDLVCRTHANDRDAGTVLLDHSWGLCKIRTDPQNEIAFVAELVYPLVFERMGGGVALVDGCRRHGGELLQIFAARVMERNKSCGVVEGLLRKNGIGKMEIEPTDGGRLIEGLGGHRDTLVGAARDIGRASELSHQGIGRKISQGRLIQERRAIALAAQFGW